MQDARNAVECFYLKVFLQIQVAALEYLIEDLVIRACECRREKDFAFAKARRHRQAFDEAIQRYRRMIWPIATSGLEISVTEQVEKSIRSVVVLVRNECPNVDPADSADAPLPSADWKARLNKCAGLADNLARDLRHSLDIASDLLSQKAEISRRIEAFVREISAAS